jgi:hypothetical protein
MHFRTHVKAEHHGISGQDEYSDGMVEHDMHVGELLKLIDDLGIADNTIVQYSTDNGPHFNTWPDAGTTPFHGEKNSVWNCCTHCNHRRGQRTGQGLRIRRESASPCSRRHKLLQRHWPARRTSLAQGVPFHVATHGEERPVVLHGEGFEAALIHVSRAGGLPVRVVPLRLRQREPTDEPRQFVVLARPDHHVPVIRHQTKLKQSHPESLDRIFHHAFKGRVIVAVLEDRLSRVSLGARPTRRRLAKIDGPRGRLDNRTVAAGSAGD